MNNRIFCTFSLSENLDSTVFNIKQSYKILYNRIFIFYAKSENEYLITYNVDSPLVYNFPKNTILVHRKKESGTLYTVNALNRLILNLNGGKLDKSFKIPWQDYQNCILLVRDRQLNKINIKLHKILSSKV